MTMSLRRKFGMIFSLAALSWVLLTAASIAIGYVAGSIISLAMGWTPPGL